MKSKHSKRKILLAVIAVILILAAAAAGIFLHRSQPEDEPNDRVAAEKTDWIAMLQEELYSEDSALTRAMSKAVTLKLVDESETSITVQVTAPDVSDAALAWFTSVSEEDYSDQALEDTLLELLEGEKTTATFVLPLDAQGKPYTTGEFLDAASGGVRKFYAALTVMFMQEMEANAND